MSTRRVILVLVGIAATSVFSRGDDGLDVEQMKMLQDPGGWEYLAISDSDNGIQTQHTCFNGQSHSNECSGTLVLQTDNAFVQNVSIHGESVQRHGTYQLTGHELQLFDEFGTKDGPYTVDLHTDTRRLELKSQAVSIQLELEKDYRATPQKQAAGQ
jgi:hypothetical protein